MKCELKSTVNMKLQGWKTVKLNEVLYVPRSFNNLLSILRLTTKGSTMGDTKDKMNTKKNGISMTLETRKVKNESTIFYLKNERYYR